MKLWQKNYKLNKLIEQFTVGDDYLLDQQLISYDCKASIAHAHMLYSIGVLQKNEYEQLKQTLEEIIELDKKKQFIIKQEDEDCHTAIENYLTEKLGDIGKKIHTGRSRNDQVLTALRLYYKQQLTDIQLLVTQVQDALKKLKQDYGSIQWPGFTHMRKAMPSSVALWADAFHESLTDTQTLLKTVFTLVDQSPLGSGAGFGVPLQLNKEMTAKELRFTRVQNNPLYVQNSRGKIEALLLHGLSQLMYDVNKMSSDLILFSMPTFGFVELPDELCTGSSIMPQKKNPDVLELLRASYHIVLSDQFQVQSMMSNLISGYHRDVQLTKKPVMNSIKLVKQCLDITTFVLSCLKINKNACDKAMTEELFATEKVYALVQQGMSFRDAYQKVSQKHE